MSPLTVSVKDQEDACPNNQPYNSRGTLQNNQNTPYMRPEAPTVSEKGQESQMEESQYLKSTRLFKATINNHTEQTRSHFASGGCTIIDQATLLPTSPAAKSAIPYDKQGSRNRKKHVDVCSVQDRSKKQAVAATVFALHVP